MAREPTSSPEGPGAEVALMRPAVPEDRARLASAIAGRSPESRFRRFLSPIPEFSARDLDRLMDLDPQRQAVIFATDRDGTTILGVGRVVYTGPERAEVAVTVADAWQHGGSAGPCSTRSSGWPPPAG